MGKKEVNNSGRTKESSSFKGLPTLAVRGRPGPIDMHPMLASVRVGAILQQVPNNIFVLIP